ncbi:helix-turn-helix domain-containing protein [Nocardia stercoris]|uniref:MarR family transcriptional regulator n=1 Tax=Nocardia stercoris TaxID=2483361 RepID=A0A3M2L6R3_9NOCA|nr:helix-turn-helix domain-containing protein [Nocardia stercoris]RMI33321.1 MarR family transcriptional regulator [Nocardia stercoris]
MPDGKTRIDDPSPPTQRVISVLEYLAESDSPRTSAQIADDLGLNRSTAGAILAGLQSRDWVRRRDDLRYELGPGLWAIAHTARPAAGSDPLDAALRALSAEVGCGVALTRMDGAEIEFVALIETHGRIPAGLARGSRLPLMPPAAATIVAHSGPEIRRAWLDRADPAERHLYARLLDDIPQTGGAVWGSGAQGEALDVLAEVVEHLARDRAQAQLRDRVLALLGQISGTAYTAEDLDEPRPLPVSYLSAPVLRPDGSACAELLIGPMRHAATRADRSRYLAALVGTARRIEPLI